MSDIIVNWKKCGADKHWCSFKKLDLSKTHFDDLKGVYIIWASEGAVVRIGSGDIKDRIQKHRNDKEITAYKDLLVTYAKVNSNQMEGVEKFLADEYNPKVGERFPDRIPISVNLPDV